MGRKDATNTKNQTEHGTQNETKHVHRKNTIHLSHNLSPVLCGLQDFLLYLVGLVHGEVLEERPDAAHDFGEITGACLKYIKEDQDNFKRSEVQKIVYLLHHSKKPLALIKFCQVLWSF